MTKQEITTTIHQILYTLIRKSYLPGAYVHKTINSQSDGPVYTGSIYVTQFDKECLMFTDFPEWPGITIEKRLSPSWSKSIYFNIDFTAKDLTTLNEYYTLLKIEG